MRRVLLAGVIASAVVLSAQTQVEVKPPWPTGAPAFRLFFLGHEIGTEHVSRSGRISGSTGPVGVLDYFVRFVDRGTTIELRATLEEYSRGPKEVSLEVKGKNYRLFTSDSEVTVAGGRAHVRDFKNERDIDLGGKPFFPIDNYAPIGVQEELIKYWLAHGQPAELASAPSGPVHIVKRGTDTMSRGRIVDRYAIDGVVWGTEGAWFDPTTKQLVALTTWAGALPFEAFRDGWESESGTFITKAAADRIEDLKKLTAATPPRQSGAYALVGARVIDGTNRPPIEKATIIVRDGRIIAVGPSATTPVPRGVASVDVSGKTIIAGLWDSHAHAGQVDWAPAYLASGVTTIRDMGGEWQFLTAIRDAIASGAALGPRYLLAGLVDGPGPQAFGEVTAGTPEEGVAAVRKYHDLHFEEMKIYDYVTPDVVAAITTEAHRLGMMVTGHVPHGMTSQSVVEAGFDQIAHMQLRGQSGSDASKAQIAFFKEHNTGMDPTESWNELSSRPTEEPLSDLFPGIDRLPRPLARMFASMPTRSGDPAAIHARQVQSLKLLKDAIDAGVLVMAGTDKGVPGFSLPREIELYVDGGMTPLEAIQAATIMPARVMKLDRELGTVEAGKRADLVVLDANPLEKISNVTTAHFVVTNGRLYDCNALWKATGFAPVR